MEIDRATYVPELRGGREAGYRRVYEAFREAIRLGQLSGGRKVPSSRELAARYGVARITVTQAYEQLVAEGYLETRRGAGTFVAKALPEGFFRAGGDENGARVRIREGTSRYVEQPAFLSGCPALDAFPVERWLKCYAKYLRGSTYSLNTYGHGDGGYGRLREAIAGHLRTQRGVRCEAGQILILSGSQPGIELVARALVKPGDRVGTENPCFRGIVDSFRLNGAEVCGVPVDELGMRVGELKRMRKALRVVVTTPARQFPLGYAMPVGRQAELLEWAREKEAWILEDDYDSEFRFRGKPLPAMQGITPNERILYLGTFSRSMFPDVRIGYLVVPKSVYPDFLTLWKAGAMNPPVSMQAALAEFIEAGDFERHLRKMRLLYARRCRWLAELVERELGEWLELGVADGGLHFVGYFRSEVDGELVARLAGEKGVVVYPISRYGVADAQLERNGLMFGFSSFGEEAMERGVRVLREVLGLPTNA
ncbi:PLP-dependent aminotransferase family protein [Pelagicoccus sp. SDUM812003]|uniref:MocR-like pyridoxine biosynthesis transcription factor PdxR n=1 Tax=Pelagicoccus sp. SDUM812003 TaxID=3041267 RepID=UPI00280F010E|nr:PLP-dependent aminotransferase family protein [Pelagicoccus sp. SDUM812003]MDQ8203130.1 PLP-dependent aminotransferase family protein [Pelagicoccus sp. SDUM812003]